MAENLFRAYANKAKGLTRPRTVLGCAIFPMLRPDYCFTTNSVLCLVNL